MKQACVTHFKRIVGVVLALALCLSCFSSLSFIASAEPAQDHTPTAPTAAEMVPYWTWEALTVTDIPGGVQVRFTDSGGLHASGYRLYYNKPLNADGLYLDFSDYSIIGAGGLPAMALGFGDDENSLQLQFMFEAGEYVNQLRYKIGVVGNDRGTLLYQSEALSSANFSNKPFYIYTELDAQGNLYITLNINNGETVLTGGYVPAEALAKTDVKNATLHIGNRYSSATPYSINFLGYAVAEKKNESNFGNKITPVHESDWVNQYWTGGGMSCTNLAGGGVRLGFTGTNNNGGMSMDGYRWLLDKNLSLNDLYFEMGGAYFPDGWPAGFGIGFEGVNSADNSDLWLRFDANNRTDNKAIYYTNYDGTLSGKLYGDMDELWVLNLPSYKFYVYTHLDEEGNLGVDIGFDNGKTYTGASIPASVLTQCNINTNKTRLRVCSGNSTSIDVTLTYDIDFYGYYQGKEELASLSAVCAAIDDIGEVTVNSQRKIKKARAMYEELADAQKALIGSYLDKLTAAEAALAAAIKLADAGLIKLSEADMGLRTGGANPNLPAWASYLTLTDLPGGGLNVAFTNAAAAPSGVVDHINRGFDLENLTLVFDNLELTDISVPFEFILYNDFHDDYDGTYSGQYPSGAPNGVTFDINTAEGTLSILGNEFDYVQSDYLKYENIKDGRFSVTISNFDNGDYIFLVEIDVGGNVVSWEVPYEYAEGFEYFDSSKRTGAVVAFNPVAPGNTMSFDLLGYKYSGLMGGINNSDVMPKYIPVTETQVDENGTPTWADDLIIAELNAVKAGGDLSALYPVLEHLEEAGINALWLCPIFDTQYSAPSDVAYANLGPQTINPAITGTDDYAEGWQRFAEFVEVAHSHNIRIILDIVTWGCLNDSEISKEAGYNSAWITDYTQTWGGYLYNWKNQGFVNWFTTQMVELAERTNCDGYRFDCEPDYAGVDICADIKKALHDAGRDLFIISEGLSDRADAEGNTAFDSEQKSLLLGDLTSTDYLTYAASHPFLNDVSIEKAQGGTYNRDRLNLVDTVKNGTYLNGKGKFKYYTMCLSNHDTGKTVFKANTLAMGYEEMFTPFIPVFYLGEEIGWDLAVDGILYYQDISAWKSAAAENSEYYEAVKQMIRVRRTNKQIFGNFAEKITDSNICEVAQTNSAVKVEAYARYAGSKAVVIVPNETESPQNAVLNINLADLGLAEYSTFTVTDAMTGSVINAEATAGDLNALQLEVESNNLRVIEIKANGVVENDINEDGDFNAMDMVALKKHLFGSTPAQFNIEAADVNKDSCIDIRDLIRIKKLLAN